MLSLTKDKAKELSRSQLRRRNDIIEAALNVFEREGFDSAKMEDIAKEAEVAKGTLYLYFDTKIDLLEGVIVNTIMPTLQKIGEVAQTPPETASQLLSQQVQIAAKRMASTEMKTLLRYMISCAPKHQQIAQFYYDNVVKKGLEHFKTTLDYGIKTGEFREDIKDIDPLVLVGAPVYSAVWNILFSDISPIDTEKLANDFTKLTLRGLMAEK